MRTIQLVPDLIPYELPDESKIETLYSDLPKKEQYWRRDTDFPSWFFLYNPHVKLSVNRTKINATRTYISGDKLISLSVEDTIELKRLVAREKRRMIEGVYIMNNGEKIYFPGVYYGVLQWVKMFGVEGDYGNHRKYQRIYSCIRDMAIKHPLLKGYYCDKAKKTGITQFESAMLVVEMITLKGITSAVMSKVFETAKLSNLKYFVHGLKNIPNVLRPTIDQRGWTEATKKIEIKTTKASASVDNLYLAAHTTVDGLDGLTVIERVHLDEPPKFPKKVPIEQVYTKSRGQANPQNVKRGIVAMTSYPPEEDTDAFFWCRKFYNEDCKIVDGLPLNGMIPFFIGIDVSFSEGFDIYGEPDIDANIERELKERTLCKTAYELQVRKRQNPLNEKESWEVGGGGSVYDNIILGERLETIEDEYAQGALNYWECNLEWTEGLMSPVRAVPVSMEDKLKGRNGLWRIYCSPEFLKTRTNLCFEQKRKMVNKHGMRYYLLQPPIFTDFVGATDPVDYARVSQMGKKRSYTASITKTIQGDLISVYYHRSEDPDKDIENIMMEMIFFNKFSIIEGNRKNVFTTLDKHGMAFFLLVVHPNGEILPYSERVSIKPVNSTNNIIAEYVRLVIKRIKTAPEQIKDTRIIRQLMAFDPENTNEWDLAVTEGLTELALDKFQSFLTSKKSLVPTYEQIGVAINALI